MKKIFLTFLIIKIGISAINAQIWYTDFEKAKEDAKEQNRHIILVFQGSDWCASCIKLDREIWDTDEFKSYSKDHFIMLKADFPRKKKNRLDKAQQEKNNKLADIYNTQGFFPFVVVLDENGNVMKETGYKNMSPSEYIKLLTIQSNTQQTFSQTFKLMGNRFEITVVAKDSVEANNNIDLAVKEITSIENLISSWNDNSQTSEINRNAGIKPVKVDAELYDLIERANGISKITDGAFDISFAAMDNIWKFDGSMTKLPSEDEIKISLEKVSYHNIILNSEKQTIFLKLEGMKIGFGAIGKGYASDKAKELLISKGVVAGIINASGDMNTWGKQPGGKDWKVAITNPLNKNIAFASLPINEDAVATSGNYEKYVVFNEERYSHIIDPRTGYPANGIISVTVFAPKAELADALATSIFVMGEDVGLNRINQMPKIECVIIDDSGKIHTSKNIKIENQ